MILKDILKLSKLIRILLLRSDYLIDYEPVLFDKIALVDIVSDKGKTTHELID